MFGSLANVLETLQTAAGEFEPDVFSRGQAARVVEELGAIRRVVDGLLARAVKRVDETTRGDRDAARVLANAVGVEESEARRMVTTAKRLDALPDAAAALQEGRLSLRQAQFVAEAARHDPSAEGALLEAAAQGMVPLKDACVRTRADVEDPAARAKRQHSARRFRCWTTEDGMVEGHFKVTPEVGGRLKAALDAETRRVFRAHRKDRSFEPLDAYAADALADLVLGTAKKKGVAETVHVVIDHAALVRGNALPGEMCEIPGVGPVNVEWVRGLLGEAFVTAVIKKGRDITTVAHFGRHIPAVLRTALLVAGHECSTEGCYTRGYLEIDHCEVDFAKGGPTAWWNLKYKCSPCHIKKSQGWIEGPPDPTTGKRPLWPPAPSQTAEDDALACVPSGASIAA